MLPYDTLAAALDEPLPPGASVRALEDFLINECFGTVRPLAFSQQTPRWPRRARLACLPSLRPDAAPSALRSTFLAERMARDARLLTLVASLQGLIKGKLDQRKRCLEVHWAAARDMKPGQLARMQATLAQWCDGHGLRLRIAPCGALTVRAGWR